MTKQIKQNKMNAKIATTSVTQTANELLGTPERVLYYLVMETAKGKIQLNVGKKTHDEVKRITDVVTKIEGIGGHDDKPKKVTL